MLLQRLNSHNRQASVGLVLFLLLCLFGNCLRGLSMPLLELIGDAPGTASQMLTDHAAMGHAPMDHAAMDHASMHHSAMDHASMGHTALAAPSMTASIMDQPSSGSAGQGSMACCDDRAGGGCQLLQDKLLSAGFSLDNVHFTPLIWLGCLLLLVQLLTQLRLLRYASDPCAVERTFLRGYPRLHLTLAVFRN